MNPPEKLYKYESFNANSLSNLKNQQIYFSKPTTFNDPFDCGIGCTYEDISDYDLKRIHSDNLNNAPDQQEFIAKFGDQPNEYFSEFIARTVKEPFLKLRDDQLQRGIACFSEIKDEILMWSHYADKHKGFCLEFDTRCELFSKAGDSGPNRPLIPFQIGHLFRVKSATDSGPNRPVIPVQIGHPLDG